MKQFTEQEVLEAYSKAPLAVQGELSGETVLDFVINLQKNYQLHVDIVGNVTGLIRNTLLGLVSPTEFYGGLLELGLPADVAEHLVKDLNEKVFVPLNKKVKEAGAVSGAPAVEIPPVTITQKMPVVTPIAVTPPPLRPQVPQNLPTGTPPYPPAISAAPPPAPAIVPPSPAPVAPSAPAETTPPRSINLITPNSTPTGTASSAKSLAERFSVPMHDLEIPSMLKNSSPAVTPAPIPPVVPAPPARPSVQAQSVPPPVVTPPLQAPVPPEVAVLRPNPPADTYVPNPQSSQPRMRTMAHDMEEEKLHPHEQSTSSWFGGPQAPAAHSAVTAPPLPAQQVSAASPSNPVESYGADPYREPLH
ncbi:MAG: hypothetical protein AAB472_00120 [Patescibacteria group bacterium]